MSINTSLCDENYADLINRTIYQLEAYGFEVDFRCFINLDKYRFKLITDDFLYEEVFDISYVNSLTVSELFEVLTSHYDKSYKKYVDEQNEKIIDKTLKTFLDNAITEDFEPQLPCIEYTETNLDMVNHPPHYEGNIECIDAMVESQGVEAVKDFCVCNAFKYIWRHRKKNKLEDIKKAKWYIDKFIELEEKSNEY